MKWRDPLLLASAIFGLWAAYAVSLAIQGSFHVLYPNISASDWTQTLRMHLSSRWIWVLFAPAIVLLTRRFPIAGSDWKRHAAIHAATFLLFSTATAALAKLLSPVLGTPPASWPLPIVWFMQLYYNFLSFLAVVSVAHAIEYYRRYVERQRHAAQLEMEALKFESRIGRAQLEVLRNQIRPHFLFNTLQTISELIHEDPGAADRMLTRLGDLLRMALDESGQHEVPLRHELAFVEAYVEIQKTRHAERLVFQSCVEGEILGAWVPQMLLQPIVENAIQHGIASDPRGGLIRLTVARNNGSLIIRVEDNGPGLPMDPSRLHEGVGLRNTRARLKALYGASHCLELRNLEEGGAMVRITLPYRTEQTEEEPIADSS